MNHTSGSNIFAKTAFQSCKCIQRFWGDNTEATSMFLQGLLFRSVTIFQCIIAISPMTILKTSFLNKWQFQYVFHTESVCQL